MDEHDTPESESSAEQRFEVPDLPGDVLKGYELTERIAEGGMGAVFRARQVSLDRTVAVKVLKPRLAKDKSFLRRFQREARAVAKLDHRNIVRAIDVGASRGWHYIVMEFVEGPSLQSVLDKSGVMNERDAIRVVWQILAALRHAHSNGLVHRDVKPDNILLPPGGDAKLCDLGLAKETEGDGTRLTVVGTAMGTPHYVSPEQAAGAEDVDVRSDIYSLGATFYHMVCGRPPFVGGGAVSLMARHITEAVTPVQMHNGALSDGVAHVIETMLAKDRDERYATPAQAMLELKAVAAGTWTAPDAPAEIPDAPASAPDAAPGSTTSPSSVNLRAGRGRRRRGGTSKRRRRR